MLWQWQCRVEMCVVKACVPGRTHSNAPGKVDVYRQRAAQQEDKGVIDSLAGAVYAEEEDLVGRERHGEGHLAMRGWKWKYI
jgi:hypothetical protein